MQQIQSSTALESAVRRISSEGVKQPSPKELALREKFQEFVAGTFYQQMLKSLRQMHDKPAYFHGGSAEEVFQGQMDQQIAEDLAKQDRASLSDSLLSAYLQGRHM